MAVVIDFLSSCNRLSSAIFRTKGSLERLRPDSGTASPYPGSLTMLEVTKISIGNVLAVGVFVIAGQIATSIAGPSATVSAVIAAFASTLTGLCYAEFSAQIPESLSSVYVYTYILVGEFFAFIVGWWLILMYSSVTAMNAQVVSGTFDYLLGNPIRNNVLTTIGELTYFDSTPDFLALIIVAIAILLTVVGLKQTVRCLDVITVTNIAVVLFTVGVGCFYANSENWFQNDGYFPEGQGGVFTAAACCFFAFLGFDIIGTAGKKSQNPRRSIIGSISIVTLMCLTTIIGVVLIMTLVAPYNLIDPIAPLPGAFGFRAVNFAKFITGIGTIVGVSIALFGFLLPFIGVVTAMARDGLLFRFLGSAYSQTDVPVYSMLAVGILSGTLALCFKLKDLVQLLALCTLSIYSIVCACVITLRYQPDSKHLSDATLEEEDISMKENRKFTPSVKKYDKMMTSAKSWSGTEFDNTIKSNGHHEHLHEIENKSSNEDRSKDSDVTSLSSDTGDESDIDSIVEEYKEKLRVAALTNIEGPFSSRKRFKKPTKLTGKVVYWSVSLLYVWLLALSFIISFFFEYLLDSNPWVITNVCVFGLLSLVAIVMIARQPQRKNKKDFAFEVPLMPWLPAVALFTNIYLLVSVPRKAWLQFVIWLMAGLSIYFLYGLRHSKEARKYMYHVPDEEEERILLKPIPKLDIMAVLMPTQYGNKKKSGKRKSSDVSYDDRFDEEPEHFVTTP